jgi:hypothetical protein
MFSRRRGGAEIAEERKTGPVPAQISLNVIHRITSVFLSDLCVSAPLRETTCVNIRVLRNNDWQSYSEIQVM